MSRNRHIPLLAGIWTCLLILPPDVDAQEGQGPGDEEKEFLEEVVVTGSRVIRSALDSPSPVTVYDASTLVDAGITTVEEFARYLPQNADNFSDSMTGNTPLRGTAGFNLRGIGLDGTLTLVNGRRVASFGASSDFAPFVDINAIPVAAIERIEILKDGASAIYGSEAVAGVVNIITRRQVEGFTVEGGYLGNNEGDGAEWDVAVTGGWSGASTFVTGSLSYFSRDIIWSRDREFASDVDFSGRGGFNLRSTGSSPPTLTGFDPDTVDITDPLTWDPSFLYLLPDPACGEHPEIANVDVFVPGFLAVCRFNYQRFTSIQNPSDRLGLTANLIHEFGGGLEAFAELMYSDSDTRSVLAPTPLFNYWILPDHPNNPFGDVLLARMRALDTGDRYLKSESTTWRALAGLRGYWSGWQWEAALMRSESEADETYFNAILDRQFQEALFGLAGPNGDQYYNPFGSNPQNPPEVIDHFLISNVGEIQANTESTLDLQVSGEFGSLGGGPVGAAFGVQGRRQEIEQSIDDEIQAGSIAATGGFNPINADRDIWSAFAEFFLPLHETFEVQLAARYDHYSDFGSTTNPKIGLGWRPVPDLLVRATWGTSFRPPTFRNLLDPRVVQFGGIGEDPHRCGISGDPRDCSGRDVLYSFQGNPDLDPDEGETFLVGLAWQVPFANDLTLQLDYWQIEHSDRILFSDNFPLGRLLLEQLDPFTNPFTVRVPQTPEDVALGIPGIIVQLNATYVNGGRIDTDGFDFELNYSGTVGAGHALSASLSYTYLREYRFGSDFMGISANEELAGGYGFLSGLPKHRANLRLGWERDAHRVTGLIAWADEFESWDNWVVDGVQTDTPFIIDSYTQFDLQYSYVFEGLRNAEIRLGCRNCTDQDPPPHNASALAEPFHEGRGLMYYIRWMQPF